MSDIDREWAISELSKFITATRIIRRPYPNAFAATKIIRRPYPNAFAVINVEAYSGVFK